MALLHVPSTKRIGLRAGRALARAELGGSSVMETFSLADAKGSDSLSHAEFWEVNACRCDGSVRLH